MNKMKRKTVERKAMNLFFVVAVGICILSGCSGLSQKEAEAEFKKANPEVVLLEQFVGEGDSDNAYYHFRYRRKEADTQLEEVWLYQRQKDGTWKVTAKEGPKPLGAKFGS
jgi:hypothetical protein